MIPLPFARPRALVGAVHLQPLPGSPRWAAAGRPPLDAVIERALSDAQAYLAAGVDGLIVENYGDAPFFKSAPPETVAALTRCAREVVSAAGAVPVGVNVLRNDAHAALSCAVAAGARFVRVNVHTGVAATDQGIVEGQAAATLRLRAALGAGPGDAHPVALLADVHVKHAVPLDGDDVGRAADDAAHRGLADAVIASGSATGSAPAAERLEAIRLAVPGVPLWLGSGLTVDLCPRLVPLIDGAIVGSAMEQGGVAGAPVDPTRASALVAAFRAAG
jgi:membrane complex biogenesis BtpA family protein